MNFRLFARLLSLWALWLTMTFTAAWLLGWALKIDDATPFVQLVAFTPWVGLFSIGVLVLCLAVRRWREAVIAAAIVVVFAALLLPRTVDDNTATQGNVSLRVLSVNTKVGEASTEEIIDLIRELKPDVLSVQELTPEVEGQLNRLGIQQLFPYSEVRTQYGASGTGLYTRFPLLSSGGLSNETIFDQAVGEIQIDAEGGVIRVQLVAVHPRPPTPGNVEAFLSDFEKLPAAPSSGPIRVLAGDFNATLDHSQLRKLVATGYRNAGYARGSALKPTWSSTFGRIPVPPVIIDHILVDKRAGVSEFSVHRISGTDHRAVFAEIMLPRLAAHAPSR